MSDDLTTLPYAVEHSCRTRPVISQNLTFALSVIAVLATMTIVGIPNLPVGVVGHERNAFVVVTNGLKLPRMTE